MRIDLVLPNQRTFGVEALNTCPQLEEMGFDGVWLTDHVVGFEMFKPVYGDYWLETLSALAYISGITKTLRLGIGVLVIPYRDAVLTAKSLATIDNLSGGRVDLGVGTGWARAEFFALGRQELFATRGPYTNEALDVMRLCWSTDGDIEFEGEFHQFRKMRFAPRPVQQPSIPLWIGSRGTARLPLRRAAKYADYWHPTELTGEELVTGSKMINEIAGREVPVTVRGRLENNASIGEMHDYLGAYKEAGCVQVAIDTKPDSVSDLLSSAERLMLAAAP